ncbi:hypothetical protein UFOVP137_42 [uncultured Caudovirales phage]|uniref:Uncharacterized protein n=1 Tax=uncultured Caudovirales phage TaxID=2100421 RepID=A0A6J5LBI4_9CAUD|nr:hypothetical protein UFOVP137_42 [uncultured Caudovirales phage]
MSLALATKTETTLEQLVDELIGAKAAEGAANKRRVAIEEQIIKLVGAKEEGATTTELDNGFKITITGKVSYSADMEKLQEICAKMPEEMRPIKTKIELDATGCKYLRANEPVIWAKLSRAITIKPAKTSVEVKA